MKVGDECYFIDVNNNNKITQGLIEKETDHQFSIRVGTKIKRKKKKNVGISELEIKANIIRKANFWFQEEYGMSIPEGYKMFVEVFEEFPEKFV